MQKENNCTNLTAERIYNSDLCQYQQNCYGYLVLPTISKKLAGALAQNILYYKLFSVIRLKRARTKNVIWAVYVSQLGVTLEKKVK